ncbi:MAG: hypothetical protein ACI9S8_002718 [Chlamydiales bacterium]|jgi:hypothetical protein
MKLKPFLPQIIAFLIFLFFTIFTVSAIIADQEDLKILEYGEEKVESIQENAFVKLFKTNVWKTTNVKGRFYCKEANTGQLTIDGPAVIEDSTIRGRVVVMGPLTIKNSIFIENLEITGKKSFIYGSTINSVFMFRPKGYTGKLVLEVSDNTFLKGSVIFDSGEGEVILKGGSKIRGAVIKGILIDENTAEELE